MTSRTSGGDGAGRVVRHGVMGEDLAVNSLERAVSVAEADAAEFAAANTD